MVHPADRIAGMTTGTTTGATTGTTGAGDPCRYIELVAADGARVWFCRHGGHVVGWRPVGGVERLWLSASTGCGPGTAIRGGVPVVWPQFAERGDGPRHGLARDRAWVLLQAGTGGDGAARARLELRADAATRALWPHEFTLTLDVVVTGHELGMRLRARNDGVVPFDFTAALHTYLRVSSTAAADVHGLANLVAEANDGSGEVTLPHGPLPAAGPVDVAVRDHHDEIRLVDELLGDVVVNADGFDSRVVWNPGAGQAPGDVHPGGETEFVCIEPALLRPVTLQPGDTWTGRQLLHATP
jgi:glucose-6-phosphate 1-epimerase